MTFQFPYRGKLITVSLNDVYNLSAISFSKNGLTETYALCEARLNKDERLIRVIYRKSLTDNAGEEISRRLDYFDASSMEEWGYYGQITASGNVADVVEKMQLNGLLTHVLQDPNAYCFAPQGGGYAPPTTADVVVYPATEENQAVIEVSLFDQAGTYTYSIPELQISQDHGRFEGIVPGTYTIIAASEAAQPFVKQVIVE